MYAKEGSSCYILFYRKAQLVTFFFLTVYACSFSLIRLQEDLIFFFSPPFPIVLLLSEVHPSRRLREAVGKQTILRRGVYPRRGLSASHNDSVMISYRWRSGFGYLRASYGLCSARASGMSKSCLSFSHLLSLEGGEGSGPHRHSNGTMSMAAEEDSSDER